MTRQLLGSIFLAELSKIPQLFAEAKFKPVCHLLGGTFLAWTPVNQ